LKRYLFIKVFPIFCLDNKCFLFNDIIFIPSFHKDLVGLLGDTALFSRTGPKGLTKGSAKGLGKGKGKPAPLPIEDAKSDEKLLEEAKNKAKKMRDVAFATIANFEDALADMKGCKFWSKAAQRDAEGILLELKTAADDIKKFVGKPTDDIELVKGKVMECAIAVKKGTSQVKELKALANKTGSVAAASSRARKWDTI
jgi:hypothetical protein